jgi:hypothetical protein
VESYNVLCVVDADAVAATVTVADPVATAVAVTEAVAEADAVAVTEAVAVDGVLESVSVVTTAVISFKYPRWNHTMFSFLRLPQRTFLIF